MSTLLKIYISLTSLLFFFEKITMSIILGLEIYNFSEIINLSITI